MDEDLRALEQRARATPDDVPTLRALATLRARAGDARGAWRAQGALARVTDAVEDWRALDPVVRAPRAPGAPRVLGVEGWAVALLAHGVVVQANRSALALIDHDGEVRWRRDVEGSAAVACGPDVVVPMRERLLLLDGASGETLADVPLTVGARPGRPPGYTRRIAVTGDRLVAWHWTGGGEGARTVLDAGERFGEVLGHHPLHARRWGAEDRAQVAAGRLVGQAPATGQSLCGTTVDSTATVWSVPDESLVQADARGVVSRGIRSLRLSERDVRTGALRWTTGAVGGARIELGSEHVVVGWSRWIEVRRRSDGGSCWSDNARELPVNIWIAGDLLVWLELTPTLALRAVDLASGEPRWTSELPPELDAWIGGDGEDVWGDLRAGDGVLSLTLGLDVWRDDGNIARVLAVSDG